MRRESAGSPPRCAGPPAEARSDRNSGQVSSMAARRNRRTMRFPSIVEIRYNTGRPIAPQLGRCHENVAICRPKAAIRQPASLACRQTMRETVCAIRHERSRNRHSGDGTWPDGRKETGGLGIALPTPARPVANYVGFVRTGNLLVVSGQLCFDADGKLVAKGKLGGGVSVETGRGRRGPARSICWRRSRPRSAISTRSCAWCGSAASSIPRRISSMGRR